MIYDTVIHIARFLGERAAVEILTLNKQLYSQTKDMRYKMERKRFLSFFPSMLVPLLNNVPRLDIGHRMGSTDYIDFIRKSDMIVDIMAGRDIVRRSFISVKHDSGVLTFFQRYSDNSIYYATGGQYPNNVFGCGGISITIGNQDRMLQDDRFTYLLRRLTC